MIRNSADSYKFVTCFCGKKYQYRKSYTKHTDKCKIFQTEIEKPLSLDANAVLTDECMKALNLEAEQLIQQSWRLPSRTK